MDNDTKFLKSNLIAHRGKHNIEAGIPENSIPAFQEALKNNYIIELDIHILKDNNIIVFHDDNLKRMTNVDKNIKDVTFEEIKCLKLRNTNYHIPLLDEVLKLVKGQVPLIIEFKYDVPCGILEKRAMEILKNYSGKFAIKSFNPFSVLWFKNNFPNVTRGQLSCNYEKQHINPIKKYILQNMLCNIITKPDFISYDIHSLPNKKVENCRKKNILILGWTIKSHSDMLIARKYCDNFICENFDT